MSGLCTFIHNTHHDVRAGTCWQSIAPSSPPTPSSTPLTMLQRNALRRLRTVAGRPRLPKPPASLFLARDLATPAAAPSPNDIFANGTNAYYADEMYRHWRQDPSSVHASWDAYFKGLDKGLGPNAFQPPPRFLPAPSDGAPALHASGGAQLDDHLKVRTPATCHPRMALTVAFLTAPGSTARPRISSARPPCRRA